MSSFLKIKNFYQKILKEVNNSNLEIPTVLFILKTIEKEVQLLYEQFIHEEEIQILKGQNPNQVIKQTKIEEEKN